MVKMDSREVGLLLAQQLFQVDDLHYGWWDEGDTPSISRLPAAQQRYNTNLIEAMGRDVASGRVLDVGCGTGKLLSMLIDRGYRAEGVIPSATLYKSVCQRLHARGQGGAHVFQCRFEDFPAVDRLAAYDAVVFSESFQYIPMDQSFAMLRRIVKPGGIVQICDFFKDDLTDPGRPDDGAMGGGHPLSSLYMAIERAGITILSDEDITQRMSPNLALIEDLLVNRVSPAVQTLGRFLDSRYRFLMRSVLWLFRKKVAKVRVKYLSGQRNQASFERSKSYRRVLLRMPA